MRQAHRTILLLALCALFATASLWLRSAFPVWAISNATHDDFLFVRQAFYLGAGQWLGPYDNLTLAKGMAYPAFILASFLAGLPLKIAEHLVYLAAAGLAAFIVTRMSGRRALGLILFAVLAFNPSLWHEQLARVIREALYGSQSLALVLLLAGAVLGHHSGWRFLSHRFLLFLAAGIVGGMYWLTREEGVWLLPAVAVIFLGLWPGVLACWRRGERRAAARMIFAAATGGALAALVAAAMVGAVAFANLRAYGLFTDNEFKNNGYVSAYGAISRIRPEAWQRYVVFPKDARQKAYALSAAARELQPTLDGELGDAWRVLACAQTAFKDCMENTGWFMWVLRDAAAAAGHYTSARESDAFFRRLAGEINAACDDGRLPCLPARDTMAPPFRWHYATDSLAVVPRLLRIVATLGNGEIGAPPSPGLQYRIDIMADLVGPVTRPSAPTTTIIGRIEGKDALPELAVRDRAAAVVRSELFVRPQPPDARKRGRKIAEFELITDCRRPTCDLVIGAGPSEQAVPLAAIARGSSLNEANYELNVDAFLERGEGTHRPLAAEKLRALKYAIARPVARAYAMAMPVLAVLALIGCAAAFVLQRSRPLPAGILALSLACAAAIAARVALLAYLDAAAWFGSGSLLYLSPAAPFFLCFVVLGIYCGACVVLGARAVRAAPAA